MIGEEAAGVAAGAGAAAKSERVPRAKSTGPGVKGVPFSLRLTGEMVSIVAMALTTLALGTALNVHAGFSPWAAIATAVAAYICMLAFHAIMPRHYTVEPDLASDSASVGGSHGPVAPGQHEAAGNLPFGAVAQPRPRVDCPTVGAIRSERQQPEAVPGMLPPGHGPSGVQPGYKQADAPPQGRQRTATPSPNAGPNAGMGYPQHPPASDLPTHSGPAKDFGNELPVQSTVRARYVAPASNQLQPMQGTMQGNPPRPVQRSGPREEDVEMIQGLIKKLADEVNTAQEARPATPKAAAEVAERATAQSVDALNKAAGSMREQEHRAQSRPSASPPSAGAKKAVSESGRPVAVNARLSSFAEALTMGRVEVLLDPIVDFDAGRARHFEVFLRLRDESGRVLDTSGDLRGLGGTGMLPRLDGARVSHASAVAMRFEGRESALFSDVTGEALGANSFLDGVAQAYQRRNSFAGQLIMTFSQADVRRFGVPEWSALRDFRSLGFRYCIAGVSDLDMDFEDLRKKGFEFVKLDSEVFLQGLPAANDTFVPASDICKYFAGLRFGVIVGRIENEEDAAKIFGFGVLLGQGTMFGGPKAVKREVLSTPAGAVA
ncbi:MAG: EAL domain-containing protein [Filomicrobium sp.]